MAQITSGIRSALSQPWVYDLLQWLMGGHVGRRDFSQTAVQAAPGMRVLDLGCGTGDLLAYLPDGLDYYGYDISPDYIEAARRRFGPRGTFTCGLLTKTDVAAQPPFDAVIASGVLHHLDDDEVGGLARLARTALRSGGRFATIDPAWAESQHPVARALIARDRGLHVRTPDGYLTLVREVFPDAAGVLRHRRWVPYTHWLMWATAPAAHGSQRRS